MCRRLNWGGATHGIAHGSVNSHSPGDFVFVGCVSCPSDCLGDSDDHDIAIVRAFFKVNRGRSNERRSKEKSKDRIENPHVSEAAKHGPA
jgi:hypothetical protein